MTPERWQQVGALFDVAVRIEPGGRDDWLRAACGGDDELRAEVGRLLAQDERAERDGLFVSRAPAARAGRTATWSPGGAPPRPETDPPDGDGADGDDTCFRPREAIAPRTVREAVSEPPEIVRARLRELPMVYILILAALSFWRGAVLDVADPTLYRTDAAITAALVGMIALLWSPRPIPLARLKALELAMIVVMAARIAAGQYLMMRASSLRGDVMMAQLCMKNTVLLTSVLILTYGLYVPKSWRRAAVVVGPLAALPFATMMALALRHPPETSWLWRGWRLSPTPRVRLFTLDALILAILAVGAAYGARTISRLRRQVAEARRLGQYRLCRRLGAGGMGEVYLAEHLLLKRPCALKLIRTDAPTDPRAPERFEREVRLTATLSHPNTVAIYDYGRAEDGTYYYVMEYLDGLSLADLVDRHGPLPPGRAVFLLRQVCGSLREAHAAALIHRDIKPSNIFAARLGGKGDVAKLLDFGLVLPRTGSGSPHLSAEGEVIGTPLFMSPEQAAGGRELDARSDIYSMGAVAYFLLTGRPPFEADSGFAAMIAHARDPVTPPSRVRDGVPDDLEHVVLRCLAKEPADRFPDADALEHALAACACAAQWDQDRADRWWREVALVPTGAS